MREALKLLGIEKGIEISFLADIPSEGTGLGSSSAVTVGLLNALHAYIGENVSSKQLAKEAVKIELDILKKPIGEQDQYAVALGGLRLIHFETDKSVPSAKILINDSIKEDFNNSLMLFYTDVTRNSEDVLSTLNIKRDMLFLDQCKIFADEGYDALISGDLKEFGKLLDTYWETKKKLSDKITTKKIDDMYTTAMRAGAIGGKVLGAGGGGFLLIMFPANKRAKVRKALIDYKELPFRFENSGSKIIFNK